MFKNIKNEYNCSMLLSVSMCDWYLNRQGSTVYKAEQALTKKVLCNPHWPCVSFANFAIQNSSHHSLSWSNPLGLGLLH